MDTRPWFERRLVGGAAHAVVFDPTNKWLAVSSSREVLIFATRNGARVAILSHAAPVVGAFFKAHDELVSATSEGEVVEWRVPEGERTTERRVTHLPVSLMRHANEKIYLVVPGTEKDKVYKLTGDWTLDEQAEIAKGLHERNVAFTKDAVLYGKGYGILQVVPLRDAENEVEVDHKFVKMRNAKDVERAGDIHPMTAIAVDARGDTAVMSTQCGRIYWWERVTKRAGSKMSYVHWHYTPPLGVRLTSNSNLISVGGEAVLGRWKVGPAMAQTRGAFLPHLSAPGRELAISEDGALAAIVCEDNSVHVVAMATMNIQATAQLLMGDPAKARVRLVDPTLPHLLVSNLKPGWLQYIDPQSSATLYPVEISGENPAGRATSGDMNYYDVQLAAFSPSGVLATVEDRVGFVQRTKRVRFWHPTKTPGKMKLIETLEDATNLQLIAAQVGDVHKGREQEIFVTADSSGLIQVWETWDKATRWRKDVRRVARWQTPAHVVSEVSALGILVTAHGSASDEEEKQAVRDYLVFWDAGNPDRLKSFMGFATDGEVQHVIWADSLVLYSTQKSLTAFDIRTKTIRWVLDEPYRPNVLAQVGVFAWNEENVVQLDPETCKPKTTMKTTGGRVLNVYVLKLDRDKPALMTVTEQGLYVFSHEDTDFTSAKVEHKSRNPFAAAKLVEQFKLRDALTTVEKTKQRCGLMAGPAHALPSISLVAPTFIQSCLAAPPLE